MTVNELKQQILTSLTPAVGKAEATAMMREIFFAVKKYSPSDIVINGDRTVLPETETLVSEWIGKVKAGWPLQYLIGRAHFMGMDLKVTPAVLIPRPETEQIVDRITDDYGDRQGLRVADIGTGSGCIAIALAKALPFAEVTAIDLSADALDVARENAAEQRVKISFIKADALHLAPENSAFDIIVSNPPYIAERERADMEPRVYEHEPEMALFVPDSDPLEFYAAISAWAVTALAPGGTLYFEINPLFTDGLRKLLARDGWTSVDIFRDYKGNYRFAVCRR